MHFPSKTHSSHLVLKFLIQLLHITFCLLCLFLPPSLCHLSSTPPFSRCILKVLTHSFCLQKVAYHTGFKQTWQSHPHRCCLLFSCLSGRCLCRVWRITRRRCSMCMCGRTGNRDIEHVGRRAEDGVWQRALPQPIFGLPDLDFLLSIPPEFQVMVTAQPKCIWLWYIGLSSRALFLIRDLREQSDLDLAWWGSPGSNIFLYLLSSFFRTWVWIVSSSWFESATAGHFSAISGYYSADLSWSLPSCDLEKLGLYRWSLWNKTFF